MNEVDIIIFDEEEITKTLIESYLGELTFSYELKKYNEFDENLISKNDRYKFIIVNVNKTSSNVFPIISELSRNKKNKFIVISNDNSTDLHVKVLRVGAKDFLLKPIKKVDFLYSLQTIYKVEILNIQNIKTDSKIHAVASVDKAVGKTTFIVNLAKEVADASGENVLLIDFNNMTNDISFLLNLEVMYNTSQYVNKLTPENASSMLSKLSRYKKSTLFVMANGFSRNEENKIDIRNIYNFFQILKQHFKYIFIDINSNNEKLYDEVLLQSDIIWMVAQPSLPMFEKIKNITEISYKGKNIRVVLNKYDKKQESNVEAYQAALGKQIYCKIPKNFIAVGSSQTNTKTLKEVGTEFDIVKSFVSLAKHIVSRG